MAEIVNGTTDILGGSVIRYNLNTTTPNQAVIRKIIAGNGITITSTGVDPGTGDVTISVDLTGSGGGSTGGGQTGGGSTGGGSTGGGTTGGSSGVGTVTSVNMTTPVGLTVLGAPITSAGTLALRLSSGYSIPLTEDVNKGTEAYSKRIVGVTFNTTNGVLTLSQADGGGLITTISNIYTGNGTLTSNRVVSSGGFTLTFNPKTFFDNGVTINATAGNVGTHINTHNYATNSTQLYFYPESGTNVAQTLNIIPKGTGFNSVFKAQFSVYNNDVIANGMTNAEFVTFRAAGSLFTFASGAFGSGVIRPLMFSSGYAKDSVTNINQLYLTTAGNVVVGGTNDDGFKLNVIGVAKATTRLIAGNFTVGGGVVTDDKIITDGIVRAAGGLNMRSPIVGDNNYIGFKSDFGEIQLWSNNANVAQINAVGGGAGSILRIGGYGYNPQAGASGFRNSILINNAITPLGNNTADYVMIHLAPEITEQDLNGSYTSGSIRGFYYNPAIAVLNTPIHYAFESTAGKIKVSDLSGTGTRMVVADASGVLSSQTIPTGNPGTVTTLSVVSANGFAGSVANASSTPAITLSTTVSGIVKGNGTALSAATAGTDYQAPISLTTTGNAGPATFIGNTLNVPVYTFVTDGLVSGGIVTWSGVGFIYDVSAAYYYLNSVYYTTTNTQVTLGAADISNPRLDIVAVNNQGQVIVIPGVPSSNPVKAQIDPTTQIELATILVPAGATSPVNILTAIIYDESGNSTWSSSATGVTVDFANAITPYTGSVTASVTASTTGTRFIQFDRISGTDSVSNYSVFKFAIRLGTAWTSTSTLAIGFYNNNTLISTEVSVLSGQFGFNINTTATYQLIQIPIANWRFTQASFNRIRLRFLNSLPAFRLDRVELQAGVVQTLVQSNNIYTTDGSLAGIRTLTLNGNYLDIVGSTATTRFLANGTISIGGTITATTLASGSDKLVLASATGVLSAVTIGTGLSYSGGILTATGTLTSASFATDYDNTVTGLRNSSNTVYTTSQNFVSGSTRVFVNGVRQSRGASYDYTETGANQITFNYAPDSGDLIVIDYIKS